MPSGAKKRKAAKKKKGVQNPISSSHHGESDGGELSFLASREHCESVPIESTEKAAMEEEGKSKSTKSNESSSSSSSSSSDDESNVVELVQSIESLPEKISENVEDLTVETSIIDPIENVDSLIEGVSLGYNDMKNEENKDLVVEVDNGLTFEQKVNESASKLPSLDVIVKVSSESKNNGVDCVNLSETPEHSDTQPLVASAPRAAQTTSWKSCCGMLELFSSSNK